MNLAAKRAQVKTHGDQPLDAFVTDQVKRTMVARVAGLTCPEHGVAAVVDVKGDSLLKLTATVQACCSKMRQNVSRKLG